LEQNPGVSSFDIYWPSWEFLNLKDSQKYLSITRALAASGRHSAE